MKFSRPLKLRFRQRSHYAEEIWKRSFISTVRPTVHTNPSRKVSFSKTHFKPEEFENNGFAFRLDRLKTEIFENSVVTIIVWFPCPRFRQTKNHRWFSCVFKFLRPSVDGKYLMLFQGKTSTFKFLRRSVYFTNTIGLWKCTMAEHIPD